MKIKCKYAVVHNPLFLAGTNLGDKLGRDGTKSVFMEYDSEEEWLVVCFKGEAGIIPSSNVAFFIPDNQQGYYKQPQDKAALMPQVPEGKPIQAQASDPVRDAVMGVNTTNEN